MRYLSVCSGIEAAKPCTQCGETKPLADFHKQPKGPQGRHSWCKDCFNAYARDTRNRKVTPEQKAKNNLWTRYRLRPEDVEQMLADQGGHCAICGQEPRRRHIDHNHETGEVRGILCHPCNVALAHAEDAEWLRLALRYLGRDA